MEGHNFQHNIEQILLICGDPGRCKACGADVWWIRTRKGKVMPWNRWGESHFADCPRADDFRKKKPVKHDDLNIEEVGE